MEKRAQHFWLALKLVPRLSYQQKRSLLDRYGLDDIFTLNSIELKACGLNATQREAVLAPDWPRIESIIERSREVGAKIIGIDDLDYPQLLREIYDPPLVIWVQGDVSVLSQPQVAIVGSRGATTTGRELSFEFAHTLAPNVAITSGLALGIDAMAHKGALEARGKTVAVVGTGIDVVYPTRNKLLAKMIVENDGAIVSEFLPGVTARPGHFPKRNRIISGLSLGVLVIEAEVKSGSLVTARTALEQNREVFAVPGSPRNPMAKGCHYLIKQGAKLVENAADIVEELEISAQLEYLNEPREKVEKNKEQGLLNDVLLASVGYETTPVDTVVSRCKLSTEEVLTRLTMLELRGLVSAVPGGYLKLHRG
ncbi:DNA-processing protein DprA [Thalassotalea euphylliae]|uniref:DNA-processing protein DprA n=1 Tax=Thalassotalea euphylliae TaxID=1655234 RepID=UPI003628A2AB